MGWSGVVPPTADDHRAGRSGDDDAALVTQANVVDERFETVAAGDLVLTASEQVVLDDRRQAGVNVKP